MKRVLAGVLLACFTVAAPRVASAQAKQGDTELQISGNTFTVLSAGSSDTNGQFLLGVGYFATDRLEIGASPVITIHVSRTANSYGGGSSTNGDGDLGLATKLQYFFG